MRCSLVFVYQERSLSVFPHKPILTARDKPKRPKGWAGKVDSFLPISAGLHLHPVRLAAGLTVAAAGLLIALKDIAAAI